MRPDDSHYPSVDYTLIEQFVRQKLSIQAVEKIGKLTCYILEGTKPMNKRVVYVNETSNGQVSFNTAVSIAYKCKTTKELLDWLSSKKGWKDGAFSETIMPKENK